jgi:V/A-type H+-transporting ATPase subunit F
MELSVRVVCRPELAPGFALAGLQSVGVERDGAAEAVQRLAAEPGVGIVLVEDRLEAAIPEDVRRHLERQAAPLLVTFPSPSWQGPGAAEAYVLELLRQAVGYRVRAR